MERAPRGQTRRDRRAELAGRWPVHLLDVSQLDWTTYHVRCNGGRLWGALATYLVPNVFVFPVADINARLRRNDVLEVYAQPVPLVVEVWSGLSGNAYVAAKIAADMKRGDTEIWRFHPHDLVLTAWRRLPAGDYAKSVLRRGVLSPLALADVSVDLDVLFAS